MGNPHRGLTRCLGFIPHRRHTGHETLHRLSPPQRQFEKSFVLYRHAKLRKPEDVLPEQERQPCRIEEGQAQLSWTRHCFRALLGTRLPSGFLSELLGVGGGFVIAPALKRHTNLSMPTIQATSLAAIALESVSGVTAAAL